MNVKNKMHIEELKIAEYFVNICNENNLKYFMMGGTLLGAIRHKGFIPWDDDMDFSLPRKDYEKLFELLKKETSGAYSVKHYSLGNNRDYPMKLESNKVELRDFSTGEEKIRNVWIDIFPLDGMPSTKYRLAIKKIRLLSIRALFKLSQLSQVSLNNQNRSQIEKLIIKVGAIFKLEKILNETKMLNKLDKELKKHSYEEEEFVVNFMGAYKFKEMFPKKIYEETKLYKFENMEFIGPKLFDKVLSQMYGEYMKLPKEEDRNKHSTEIIDKINE